MNIFVAKLSYSTQETTLRDLFEAYGEVESVKIIYDRDSGRSKGFGFVEMPDEDEGMAAINELNESTVDGRTVLVQQSKPRRDDRNSFRGR
jgi:RNA recognition motif-containing protein